MKWRLQEFCLRSGLKLNLDLTPSPIEDLTDVTLAIEDTDEEDEEDDEDDEDDKEDLTYVTVVSDDTYWRLDWCYSSNWGSDESYQVMKVMKWWKLSSDESYQLWGLSSDESYQIMKVIKWWKFSSDESYQVMKVI